MNSKTQDPVSHASQDAAPCATAVTPRIYLYPGRLFSSREPHVVTTVLGSCVAVCLWDARCRAGGMNHFLLPECPEGQEPSPRFGAEAIELLIGELLGRGCSPRDLQAKIFGGSHVLGTGAAGDRSHLGARNVTVARRTLAEHGIPIVAADVGGTCGRKVSFRTDDGVVHVKDL